MTFLDDEADMTIITFFLPDTKPDMRIKVFDTAELHLHSSMLKIHSGFFRKFLDSPEKIIPASKEFTYEWVSKIDEDGSWHVVAAQSVEETPQQPLPVLQRPQDEEQVIFISLLAAIYNEPYRVTDLAGLERLVELADYYLCLRCLSRTIDGVLLRQSGDLGNDVFKNSSKAVDIAIRLRQPTLLLDAMIFQQGPWTAPLYLQMADSEARATAEKLNGRIHEKIGRLTCAMMTLMSSLAARHSETCVEMREFMQKVPAEARSDRKFCASKYYRLLRDFKASDGTRPFKGIIDDSGLLKNDTKLAQGFAAGLSGSEDYFYCGSIPHEDLPWDTAAEDW